MKVSYLLVKIRQASRGQDLPELWCTSSVRENRLKSFLQFDTNKVTGINFFVPYTICKKGNYHLPSSWGYRDYNFLGRYCEMFTNFQVL